MKLCHHIKVLDFLGSFYKYNMKILCKICNKDCKDIRALCMHIVKKHKSNKKDYYDNNLKKENEGICPICNKETVFVSLSQGYRKYCSTRCANNDIIIKEKIIKTQIKKYGGMGFASNSIKNKIIKTATKNGNKISSYENLQKMKISLKEKYGYEYPSQIEKFKEQIKNTKDEKNIGTNPKYKYNGIFFDSSWEIAYYIWLVDHNKKFEYHNGLYFTYDYNGIQYRYYPDFIIDNKIIEIKNNYIYEKMLDETTIEHAKYKCMLKNNVEILFKSDIELYLNYIKLTYGKDYLERFKCQ